MDITENDCCICLEQIEYCPFVFGNWKCTHYNCICIKCYESMSFNKISSKCPLCRSYISNKNSLNVMTSYNNNVNIQFGNFNQPENVNQPLQFGNFNQPLHFENVNQTIHFGIFD